MFLFHFLFLPFAILSIPKTMKSSMMHNEASNGEAASKSHHGISKATNTTTASQKIAFAKVINRLKSTRRTGWTYHDIPNPESVSDHSWRVATLCFLLADEKNVDFPKCVQMALLHDLAEALIGDITPRDNVSPQTKSQLEEEAVTKILSSIKESPSSSIIHKLIQEYEDRETYESKLVKDFDLLDMILQAEEYESVHEPLNLQEFFESGSEQKFLTDYVRNLASELHTQRTKRKEDCIINEIEKRKDNTSIEQQEEQPSLYGKDEEFILKFSSSSHMSKFEVENVVKALRKHENDSKE